MKKLIALMLALIMVMALAACTGNTNPTTESTVPTTKSTEPSIESTDPVQTVMSYDEFMAAEIDAKVCVESYVQAHQSWWFDDEAGHGKVTIYLQDTEGAYFAYEVNCTEEVANELYAGTKVRITGDKAVWAGEVEIMNATLEIVDSSDSFYAAAQDVTDLLGTDELESMMNHLVSFEGMTVSGLSYKDSQWDPDIYVSLTKDGAEYSFCVENYLTGPDSEVYKAVSELKEGDVIDLEGFLYWYEGPNTHITSITVAE